MLWNKPINKKAYKRLKEVISDIIYDDNKDFHKQAQELADELMELSWGGQMNLLITALGIIFKKFNEIKEEK